VTVLRDPTQPSIRSPKGRAARSCSEVAGVRPKVGVVAKGQVRKVLFGGVGVRPKVGAAVIGLFANAPLGV
jgi:hypothetical protein